MGREKDMKTCPNCKTQVGDEAVFCGECGQRLQEPAETTDNRAESSQNDSAEQPRDKKQENFPMQFIWIVVALAVVGVLFAYWKLILMLICWICFIAACVYVVRMFLAKREAGEEYESDPSYKSFKERAIGFGVGCLIALFVGSCGLKIEDNAKEEKAGTVKTPVQTVTSQWQCGNCSRIVSKKGTGQPPTAGCPKGGTHLWLRMK